MSSYSLVAWAEFCHLQFSTPLPEDVHFEHLFIDTREIVDGSNGVFFCLKGRRNGHDFIQDAIDKGVLAVVIEKTTRLMNLFLRVCLLCVVQMFFWPCNKQH